MFLRKMMHRVERIAMAPHWMTPSMMVLQSRDAKKSIMLCMAGV